MSDWTIGFQIEQRLRRLGWTQSQLAERLGRRQPTISRWRRGLQLPQLEDLPALAEWLDVPLGELQSWWMIETQTRHATTKQGRIVELEAENAELKRQLAALRDDNGGGGASPQGNPPPRHARRR